MWNTAEKLLQLNLDVILDFGCWAKSERDEFRQKAHAIGANFKIHYMDCPLETIWERLNRRNHSSADGFYISKASLEKWSTLFEPPTKEELDQSK